MALSSTYAKLVALLMAALLIMTPAVLAQCELRIPRTSWKQSDGP